MGRYEFTITGKSALLMHGRNLNLEEEISGERTDPNGDKTDKKPGDDRTPAWTWQSYLYTDGELIALPTANIMSMFLKAGAAFKLKGNETFRSLTQSALLMEVEFLPILVGKGRTIAMDAVEAIRELKYNQQAEAVQKLGFRLDCRPVVNPGNKRQHIRVRPRFDDWCVVGTLEITDPSLGPDKLAEIFHYGGMRVGLGDWRPGCKTPGLYGRFNVKIKPV